jgi:hypothetical protein
MGGADEVHEGICRSDERFECASVERIAHDDVARRRQSGS